MNDIPFDAKQKKKRSSMRKTDNGAKRNNIFSCSLYKDGGCISLKQRKRSMRHLMKDRLFVEICSRYLLRYLCFAM